MPIPVVPRVLYEKNLIVETVCQLKFPAILKIDAELPAIFQESLRKEYPIYESKSTFSFAGLPEPLLDLINKELPVGGRGVAHEFKSRDGQWILSLTREFIALQCQEYRRWEDFRQRIQNAMQLFIRLYEPAFMTRIGLRYRDVIQRLKLNLVGVSWSELLNPWVAGPLGLEFPAAGEVMHTASQTLMSLSDGRSRALLQNGITKEKDGAEECYAIDLDLFDENQTETQNAGARLDFLHSQAHQLFRACIGSRLHEAMRPGPDLEHGDDSAAAINR